MSFKNKILMVFLALALFPVCIIGSYSYHIHRIALEHEIYSFLTSINQQKHSRVTRWLEDASDRLEFLADIPTLNSELKMQIDDGKGMRNGLASSFRNLLVEKYLKPALRPHIFIELFILRSFDGTVILSTDPEQEGKIMVDRSFFKSGIQATHIENPFYSMTIMQPSMVISTPLCFHQGKAQAVLVGRLNLADLSEIMEHRSDLKRTEDTYLVNSQNFFMTEPRYTSNYMLRKTVHTEGVKKALNRESGIAWYADYRGIPVIGAYMYLQERKLALISEIDQQEFMEPMIRLKQNTFVIAAVVTIVALVAGWAGTNTIIKPVLSLMKSVNRIDSDNLDFSTDLKGDNEITRLANAFSSMTIRLKDSLVSREKLVLEVEQRKRYEADLQKVLRQLNQSNQELEQFAYVASHDLQEPLRMVSSYTQLLADRYQGQLDEKANKFIYYAVDGATRMQVLIHDLLSFSRVTTKGKELVPVDLHKVLGQAILNLQIAIQESSALVTNDDLPKVKGDESQLVQLMQNLICNSIKFNRNQIPHIHIQSQPVAEGWCISIRDNGIGIDKKYSERIFIIFQRLHTREKYGGTGIGLAICKRIVERHGGTIWFESETGKGTVFFITLEGAMESQSAEDFKQENMKA